MRSPGLALGAVPRLAFRGVGATVGLGLSPNWRKVRSLHLRTEPRIGPGTCIYARVHAIRLRASDPLEWIHSHGDDQ